MKSGVAAALRHRSPRSLSRRQPGGKALVPGCERIAQPRAGFDQRQSSHSFAELCVNLGWDYGVSVLIVDEYAFSLLFVPSSSAGMQGFGLVGRGKSRFETVGRT